MKVLEIFSTSRLHATSPLSPSPAKSLAVGPNCAVTAGVPDRGSNRCFPVRRRTFPVPNHFSPVPNDLFPGRSRYFPVPDDYSPVLSHLVPVPNGYFPVLSHLFPGRNGYFPGRNRRFCPFFPKKAHFYAKIPFFFTRRLQFPALGPVPAATRPDNTLPSPWRQSSQTTNKTQSRSQNPQKT